MMNKYNMDLLASAETFSSGYFIYKLFLFWFLENVHRHNIYWYCGTKWHIQRWRILSTLPTPTVYSDIPTHLPLSRTFLQYFLMCLHLWSPSAFCWKCTVCIHSLPVELSVYICRFVWYLSVVSPHSKSVVCVNVIYGSKLQPLNWLLFDLEWSSEINSLWMLPPESPCIPYRIQYTRPCPLPSLLLAVINGGTQGSHQAVLKEFQSLCPPSPPSPSRLQSLCAAPSLTSFYSLVLLLVSISPVFCPLTLCLSSPERDTWQMVCPPSLVLVLSLLVSITFQPPPLMPSSHTCVSGRLSVLSRGELRRKDCFSCVYTKTVRPPFSQNYPGPVKLCAVCFNRCPHMIGFLQSFVWIWFCSVLFLVIHWCGDWNKSDPVVCRPFIISQLWYLIK